MNKKIASKLLLEDYNVFKINIFNINIVLSRGLLICVKLVFKLVLQRKFYFSYVDRNVGKIGIPKLSTIINRL